MWNVYAQAGGQSLKNEKIRYRDLYSASIPYPIEGTIHDFFRFEATLETQANRFDQNGLDLTRTNRTTTIQTIWMVQNHFGPIERQVRKFVLEEWLAVSSS